MQIGLNAQLLHMGQTYRGAGVSNYCAHLLRELGAMKVSGEIDHGLTAFVNESDFRADGVDLAYSGLPLQQPLWRIAWEQTMLPLRLGSGAFDLIHGLVNVLPLSGRVPGVVTVHDLSFVRRPETLPRAKRLYLTRLCQASVRRAERVIAVSRQTANDLIACFDLDAARIEVVYNGVGAEFSPDDGVGVAQLRRREQLPQRFLLYLGTLEPRKNLEVLIRGYARWVRALPSSDDPPLLVLAGAKGWFYEQIFQLVQDLELETLVRFPGYIPAADLPDWYRAAFAFVYPSLFEGFGLPVLEAMACGTPVLCSRAPSLLEIAADCAITFDAGNEDELVASLGRLVSDDTLRADLRRCGLRRAQSFGWRRTAQATADLYSLCAR